MTGPWRVGDIRPLVRLGINVVVGEGDRQETGSYGAGGRTGYDLYLDPATWKPAADEALRQAIVNLRSVSAPAGAMPVVLGSGWPGILLHEAIGHGLEGDFNRKKTSAFAGLMRRTSATGRPPTISRSKGWLRPAVRWCCPKQSATSANTARLSPMPAPG